MTAPLACPKCHCPMEPVTCHDIEVDRCTNCGGIWFDLLEHEELKRIAGSEAIDTGSRDLARCLNRVADIECPVCHTRAIPMVDRDQPHIWYEACTVCNGVFFDAGEFTDFKYHTVADFVRDLAARAKGGRH